LQVYAQTDSNGIQFSFHGYVKDLNTILLALNKQPTTYTQLIHNRMNMKWNSTHFNASLELRNRLFWGDLPRQDPMLAKHLENTNEKIIIPIVWMKSKNSLIHSNIERAWIEYKQKKWSTKIGRQRINWGMNNSWNPNDIFNSYNLLDFDYEERSGVDAIRIHHALKEMEHLEWGTAFHSDRKMTSALKYAFNSKGVDWQLLAGVYRSSITLGTGWQGSMGKWGFKGELQYFSQHQEQKALLNGSLEIDRLTPKNGYVYGSILYTQPGLRKSPSDWSRISFRNSPAQLMPAQWNVLIGFRKEISPRLNSSIGLIHSPFVNLWIIYPSLSFSAITDLDIDIFWQSFYGMNQDSFGVISHSFFLRGRWSF
jgi:hypothetical protein